MKFVCIVFTWKYVLLVLIRTERSVIPKAAMESQESLWSMICPHYVFTFVKVISRSGSSLFACAVLSAGYSLHQVHCTFSCLSGVGFQWNHRMYGWEMCLKTNSCPLWSWCVCNMYYKVKTVVGSGAVSKLTLQRMGAHLPSSWSWANSEFAVQPSVRNTQWCGRYGTLSVLNVMWAVDHTFYYTFCHLPS